MLVSFFISITLGVYYNDLWKYPLPQIPIPSSTVTKEDLIESTTINSGSTTNSTLIGGLIGGIIGFLLLILISILIIIFVRRRKKRKASHLGNTVELTPTEMDNHYSNLPPSSHYPSSGSFRVSSGKKEWEIEFNELEIEEKIGEGGFGVVYKVSEVKD